VISKDKNPIEIIGKNVNFDTFIKFLKAFAVSFCSRVPFDTRSQVERQIAQLFLSPIIIIIIVHFMLQLFLKFIFCVQNFSACRVLFAVIYIILNEQGVAWESLLCKWWIPNIGL
jgi:hypothetical protein